MTTITRGDVPSIGSEWAHPVAKGCTYGRLSAREQGFVSVPSGKKYPDPEHEICGPEPVSETLVPVERNDGIRDT